MRRRAIAACAVLALTLAVALAAACKPRPGRGAVSAPAPAPVATAAPSGTPVLRVTLSWHAPVDLDLYVTDPGAVTVYFGHTPTARGQLLADTRCGGPAGERVETVVFPAPPPGGYRVGVDYSDACGTRFEPAAYRIVVDGTAERIERAGTAEPDRFAPIALELEVAATPTPAPTAHPRARNRRR